MDGRKSFKGTHEQVIEGSYSYTRKGLEVTLALLHSLFVFWKEEDCKGGYSVGEKQHCTSANFPFVCAERKGESRMRHKGPYLHICIPVSFV